MTEIEAFVRSSQNYAGVGSRQTPDGIVSLMDKIGGLLAGHGLTLRSGGAPGADMAFECGCDWANGGKEIFLPWKGFNGNCSPLFSPPKEAEELAALCHPNWKACTPIARRFHARNCQQVCGQHLDDPVGFVLFWAHERDGAVRGGTATAVYLARRLGIPTFNLRCPTTANLWRAFTEANISRQLDAKSHPLSFINRIMGRSSGS